MEHSIIYSQELFGFLTPQIKDKIIGLFEIEGQSRGRIANPIRENIAFDGKIWLSDMKVFGHYIENLIVPTKYDKGKLSLDNIHGVAIKTDLDGSIKFDFTNNKPQYLINFIT